MTYLTYFSEYTLPYQGVAARVVCQTAAFNRARGPVVYWLVALADFGPAQGLPPRALVTYRLNLASPAVEPAQDAAPVLGRAPNLAQPLRTTEQRRNYLLDYQQAVYDEMEAGRLLVQDDQPMIPLSLAEITRDLAGWTAPPVRVPSKPAAAPKPGRRAALKRRAA
ncbi:hypothetical protein [Hymenobacter convexus]|uniref:hypothetical protein n=1 Tax=Hymenobacter sp. CA1UV-4 TaxID=3063782 RepID=UPI0027132128|nr:hypothetical protein [Hymenobacter sp. CA1UV-4]MDO7854064.1 hypothetical protein [Hymenobacter sp. CA1UV-4]